MVFSKFHVTVAMKTIFLEIKILSGKLGDVRIIVTNKLAKIHV